MVIVTDEHAAKSAKAPVKPRVQGPSDPPAYSDVEPRVQQQGSSERDAMLVSSHHPHHHYNRPDLEGLPHHHHKHDQHHHQRKSFFSRHGSDGSSGHGHGHGRSPGQVALSRFCNAWLSRLRPISFRFCGAQHSRTSEARKGVFGECTFWLNLNASSFRDESILGRLRHVRISHFLQVIYLLNVTDGTLGFFLCTCILDPRTVPSNLRFPSSLTPARSYRHVMYCEIGRRWKHIEGLA